MWPRLAQVTERKPATPQLLQEVRDEVRNAWLNEKRQESIQAYIETLKSRATIEETGEEEAATAPHDHAT